MKGGGTELTKPALAQDTPHGRMYIHPKTREAVYSVTTIIEQGIPKPGLVPWVARETARYAWSNLSKLAEMEEYDAISTIAMAADRLKNEAAEKGDEVHVSTENYLKGNPDGNSVNHMAQLKDFLEVSRFRPAYTEVTVWNRDQGYAGTADLIAETPQGHFILIDYKSGKRIWPEAFLQVEALARANFILLPDGTELEMPYLEMVGVLHLRPKSWWYWPNGDHLSSERNWNAFLAARDVADWRRLHPNLVFGPTGKMNSHNWQDVA